MVQANPEEQQSEKLLHLFLGVSFLDNPDIQVKIADLGNACWVVSVIYGPNYSRMGKVKFVEGSL